VRENVKATHPFRSLTDPSDGVGCENGQARRSSRRLPSLPALPERLGDRFADRRGRGNPESETKVRLPDGGAPLSGSLHALPIGLVHLPGWRTRPKPALAHFFEKSARAREEFALRLGIPG